jgi:hypothetical protein
VLAGALKVSVIAALPRVPLVIVGAPGGADGMVGSEAADDPLVPTPFVAVAVHVYVLPFVSPFTVIGDPGPELLPDVPPSRDEQATVKEVMALPLSAPAVNTIVIDASPPDALVIVGAAGAAAGTTAADAGDGLLLPSTFVATTVQV